MKAAPSKDSADRYKLIAAAAAAAPAGTIISA